MKDNKNAQKNAQNTTTENAQKEVQVMNQAANAAKTEKAPEKPAKGEKPAKSEKTAKASTAAKIDFKPALSYLDRVRAGKDEIQSINACFRATKNAYNFLQGLNFKDFASHMNARYRGKHNIRKGWSAWYAAQFVESYISEAAKDPKSIDHAASRNYLIAEKLQRDAEGLRKL